MSHVRFILLFHMTQYEGLNNEGILYIFGMRT